jgi:S-layer protein
MATITGTDASDFLLGTADADLVNGGLGNDTIRGLGGNDTLNGAEGNDDIDGGDGNDSLIGGAGNDTIQGGMNSDTIDGGAGDDVLRGGKGFDSINGGDGNDTIYSGLGQDTLTGGAGADVFVVRGSDPNFPGALKAPTITDFVAGTDSIVVEGATDADITAALAAQTTVDGGVSLSINGATVVVKGTGLTSLSAANVSNTLPSSNPGQTFTLTIGENVLTGTSGNDTFSAPVAQGNAETPLQTLESIDVLDGGDGVDTLNATLNGDDVAARISNIEVFNLRATAATTVDFADVTGVEQVWNTQSGAAVTLTYDNAPIAATFGVRNTASLTDIITFDDVSGDDDVLNLVVTGAGTATQAAVVSSTTDAGAIEGLNVTASGTNFVDLSAFTAVESLTLATSGSLELEVDGTAMTDVTITGSGALDLTDAGFFSAVENVVATGFSGDLTLDISASGALESVATGAGDDTITVDGDLLVAAAEISIDLGEGENTLRLTNIDTHTALGLLVFTGDDLTVAGVSTLSLVDALVLGADATLDLDGIAPSAIVVEGAVTMAGFDLTLDNTAAALDLTFEAAVNSAAADAVLNLGDAAETVTITAEAAVGATNAITVAGEALASLTLNLENDADINVGLTEEALESVVINATGDAGATTITSTISGDAAEEFSLTSLTLADATDDGDTTFDITLVETVNLTTISLSGGEATDFTLDVSAAAFDAAVTVEIGDFGVDADGVTAGGLSYTSDEANGVRETFKFVGVNIGDVTIETASFLEGIGSTADRLDFSAIAGIDALDDLSIEFVGGDTEITAADGQFDGTITVVGVDITTDAVNFIL